MILRHRAGKKGHLDEELSAQAANMFRIGVRTFATIGKRAAETVAKMEGLNQYGIGVSKAQGVVKGLTGGK
jgi:hypothetical protein